MVLDRGDGEEVVVPIRISRIEWLMEMFVHQNHIAMNKRDVAYWQ